MGPGGVADAEFDIPTPRIVVGDQRQIDLETFLHGRIGTAVSNAVTVRFVGELLAKRRQVLLAGGMLPMCQACGAFVRQRHAAPQEITGGAPLGGLAGGLREHPTTEPGGHLVRVDRVMCGLPAMDGLHGQGMPEDNREAGVGPEVGEPGPR